MDLCRARATPTNSPASNPIANFRLNFCSTWIAPMNPSPGAAHHVGASAVSCATRHGTTTERGQGGSSRGGSLSKSQMANPRVGRPKFRPKSGPLSLSLATRRRQHPKASKGERASGAYARRILGTLTPTFAVPSRACTPTRDLENPKSRRKIAQLRHMRAPSSVWSTDFSALATGALIVPPMKIYSQTHQTPRQ